MSSRALISGLHDGAPFGIVRTVTITDDEAAPEVTLLLAPASIGEDGGMASVTASVAPASAEAFTVTVSALAVEPGSSSDFTLAGATLSFASGATESTGGVTITAVDNEVDAPDKSVTVSGAVSLEGVTAPADATLTILDDDTAAALALEVDATTMAEDGGTVTVTVTTGTGSTFDSARDITLVFAGTATEGGDYTVSATELTLPAGASGVTATLTALDDDVFEGGETVLISGLHDGAPFGIVRTVTITDDEAAPEVTLLLAPASIGEDGGMASVTASVAPASAEAFTVTVSALAVEPGSSSDFTLAGATLSFASGATESTGGVTITAVDNEVDAPDKSVTVSGAVSLEGVTAPADATLTILDDDTAAALALEVDATTMAEDGGTVTVTVTTGTGSTFDSARDITLVFAGTATEGGDYTVSATELTLPAGASGVTATLTALDDDVFEGGETVLISGLHDGAPFGIVRTVTITDDEAAPEVTLLLAPASIGEDGGMASVTASVAPASAEAFTVTVSALAVEPGSSSDFTLAGATLSFASGATESTGGVTITAVDNEVDAPDKSVTVSGAVSLEGVTAPADATLTILDDDTAAALALEVDATTMAEDGGTVTVTVTTGTGSTFDSARDITLVFAGTATEGGDYTVSATELTLPAGASGVTATLTALDDDVFEGGETVLISGLHDGAPFGIVRTVTITDDEAAPEVTLLLAPASIGEDGGMASVTASVAPASAEAFTVTVSALAVEPGSSSDFTLAGATLSFASGATESTGGVTITAVDNEVDAPDKSVTVSGAVSLEGVTAPADATLTILDDDTGGAGAGGGRDHHGEDGGTVTVTVTTGTGSTFDSARDITLVFAGTAVEGGDYTLAGATLSFASGATESTGGVTITAVDNEVDAPDKSVTVSGAVSLEGVTAPADATLTILDDDTAAALALEVDATTMAEDGGTVTVTVTTGTGSTFDSARDITLVFAGTASRRAGTTR